ncbi:MAG TPA: DEAD/DEAH box helicase [Myxococcota bacterium]|nr:DEAD/DEAH box helicase [Myxococcota bacterium]
MRFAEDLARLPTHELGGTLRALLPLSAQSGTAPGDSPAPPLAAEPADELKGILSRRKIGALWSHQAEALARVQAGRDVLLATPTASGKSLVYNLAAAARVLARREARALFLFPLKALEHDQLGGLRADLATLSALDPPTAEIYDGDTSPHRRKKIRESPPSVLLSTPDMLHAGILPGHEQWQEFFRNLELVVVDEVHTYRGVLGAHFAQVLRRLVRIARHYGAEPRFIACSATIGNPGAFARELFGRELDVVDADGAPPAQRWLATLEPEVSTYTTAARLFRRCVHAGLRTIAFTQARRVTELMHLWILEAEPALAPRISSYRSGFLPEERRAIERRLFDGDLLGVISTSALELGIDVGGLDVCILVGYPGSVLATRQRAGRVARGREGLVFLIPQEDALDRFFLRHPERLVTRPCEDAVLDATSEEITAAHLPCAAAEVPLLHAEPWLQPPGLQRALALAHERGGLLESAAGGESFAARRDPARQVSLRSAGESFAIRRAGDPGRRVVGTIGRSRVSGECHPGAIYLHRAQTYQVTSLDFERRQVEVLGPHPVDWYTRPVVEKETEILEVLRSRPIGNTLAKLGRLRVTSWTKAYEKRRIYGQDLLGRHPLELPPTRFETEGVWLELAPQIERVCKSEGRHFMGGIHGLEHAALALFPLFALCDRFDAAGISIPRHPQVRGPAIFLYDSHAGGIGISRAIFPKLEELVSLAGEITRECPCADGCPSCIHSPRCGAGNHPLDKRAVVRVVDLALAREPLPAPAELVEPELFELPWDDETPPARAEPGPVIFDVETQRSAQDVGGWQNTHLMRLALAVVYDTGTGEFETYTEARAEELVARLFSAPAVLGFNVRRFDYAVLRAYSARRFEDLPTFDLLEDVQRKLGYRLSLDHLARETLGRGKTGDGLQSLDWWKQGRLDLIETYCRMDVELCRDLLAFAARERHVLFQRKDGERVRLPVDWDTSAILARIQRLREAGGVYRASQLPLGASQA